MNRALVLSAALVVLAGCGTDTCQSDVGKLQSNLATTCSLAPVSNATVQVGLCGRCQDSSPSCDAEFRDGILDVGTTVQQCQADSGCATQGCNSNVRVATCTVRWTQTPSAGVYTLSVVGDTQVSGTVTIGGSNTTCQLLGSGT